MEEAREETATKLYFIGLQIVAHKSRIRSAFLSIEFEEFASFDESGLRAEKRIKDHIVALGN